MVWVIRCFSFWKVVCCLFFYLKVMFFLVNFWMGLVMDVIFGMNFVEYWIRFINDCILFVFLGGCVFLMVVIFFLFGLMLLLVSLWLKNVSFDNWNLYFFLFIVNFILFSLFNIVKRYWLCFFIFFLWIIKLFVMFVILG